MAGTAAAAGASVSAELAALLAGRDTRWYKGYLLKLNLIIVLVLITSMTNGYDGSMMNGLQALDNWKEYFDHPEEKETIFGIFNAIQNIGSIVGFPFAPYVSDHYGRRAGIFLGACIMLAGTAIQTGAQNVGMFIASRGLVGFGLAFSGVASPVLITELAFPSHRAPLTSMYNSSWYLGSIVAAWTTYGTFRMTTSTWSWRIPSVLQGLPSIIQFLLIWFIPESPRWLIDHGKEDQARAVIAKYHCGGNADDPLVEFEFSEMKEMIRLEKENKASWKEIFTQKANLRRVRIVGAIALFSQWSGNGLVSYYLTLILNGIGITKAGDQTLINGILQIYNYFWAIVGALTVDKVGRRFLFLTSTSGMCISFVCWTICSALYAQSSVFDPTCVAENNGDSAQCVPLQANRSAGNTVIAFIFLFYGFYDIAMTPLLVSYTVEVSPYRIRSKMLAFMNICVSVALVFNQYINPIALARIHWRYYIVFCVFLAFEVVYCFFFVIETRGPNGPLPLEEIAMLFEGPGRYGFQKSPGQLRRVSVSDAHFDSPHADNMDNKAGDPVDHVESVPSLKH